MAIGGGAAAVRDTGGTRERRPRIGECLLRRGVVTEATLQSALVESGRSGVRLGSVLVQMDLATEHQVSRALADQLGLEFVDLAQRPPEPDVIVRLPKGVALRHTCVAVAAQKNRLTLATSDPLPLGVERDLEFQTGCRIVQALATRADIARAIEQGYPETALALVGPARADSVPASTAEPPLTAPAAEMVDLIVQEAFRNGASDIHVEPTASGVVVRHRLDGLLTKVMELPAWLHAGLVTRVKVMAALDIAEKRLPQDGHIRADAGGGRAIDLRVSTIQTVHGEKVVLRVLDQGRGVPMLDALGFSPAALEQLRRLLRHTHGMVLVVGPTGSGKTTTLGAALAALRSERVNVVTIEDPVEYRIPGVNQTQVNAKIDLTFARALRAILRQDPDVVLVGEIRDLETARIAMQAAQTGHLVLSTLHTDDAPASVARLTDIGIEPCVSAAAVIGVVAQRLVRRLCTHCRQPVAPLAEACRAIGLAEAEVTAGTFYRAVGCGRCRGTGYSGRIGVYEVMPVTDELRRLIARKEDRAALRTAARAHGMQSLGEDAAQKVAAGTTTLEELHRVVPDFGNTPAPCLRCGERLGADFVGCPACGCAIESRCTHCGRSMRSDWKYCPHCMEEAGASGRVLRETPRFRAVR